MQLSHQVILKTLTHWLQFNKTIPSWYSKEDIQSAACFSRHLLCLSVFHFHRWDQWRKLRSESVVLVKKCYWWKWKIVLQFALVILVERLKWRTQDYLIRLKLNEQRVDGNYLPEMHNRWVSWPAELCWKILRHLLSGKYNERNIYFDRSWQTCCELNFSAQSSYRVRINWLVK